jgi:N-acetylmuramoyl-L-alanine amidase
MKKILIKTVSVFLCILFLLGCASVGPTISPYCVNISDYQDIESFCRKNKLKYNFDTVDDIITLRSKDNEVKILINSLAAVVGGTPIMLKNQPFYSKGKILVPRELEKIITNERFVDFRPLFNIKTIVLDPGHGGKDPGAISACGLKEKTINLIITKILRKKLQAKGYRVIMTRTRDVFLSLAERTAVAKRANADLFISVHANANRSRKVSGVEVYYLNPNRLNSAQRAIKMSKRGKFNRKPMSRDAVAILWDLLFTKNHSFSTELSNLLYFNFKKLGFSVKPPRTAGFYVLKNAYVPSVLVEAGYLSNVNEAKALRKSYYQKQVAEAIMLSVEALSKRYVSAKKNKFVRGN